MENAQGDQLDDIALFPNPSAELLDAFTSNFIYFNGPLSMIVNNGNPVRLYAPATFEQGSSLQHVNESTFPSGNPNTLMTPFSATHEVHHSPGPLTIAMLEDIGWNVNHSVGLETAGEEAGFEIFPNPVENVAYLRTKKEMQNETLSVYNLLGQLVHQQIISTQEGALTAIHLEMLPAGIYVMQIGGTEMRLVKR
jgi:hypothetical protein